VFKILKLDDENLDALASLLHVVERQKGFDLSVSAIASTLSDRPAGVEFLVAIPVGADAPAKVVGFASYSVLFPSTGFGLTSMLYLKEIFVAPTFRRQGIATALMANIARIARAKKCPRVGWTVAKQNRAAQALYDRLGAQQADWLVTYRLAGEALGKLADEAQS
jgi:ribosomal protein S18 acetylase RimI-like enzyme